MTEWETIQQNLVSVNGVSREVHWTAVGKYGKNWIPIDCMGSKRFVRNNVDGVYMSSDKPILAPPEWKVIVSVGPPIRKRPILKLVK